MIDEKTYNDIEMRRIKTGESEDEIIQSLRIVSDEDFVKVKAKFLRVPFVDLDNTAFSPEALSLVPESVAQKIQDSPLSLGYENKNIVCNHGKSAGFGNLEFLEKKTSLKIVRQCRLKSRLLHL